MSHAPTEMSAMQYKSYSLQVLMHDHTQMDYECNAHMNHTQAHNLHYYPSCEDYMQWLFFSAVPVTVTFRTFSLWERHPCTVRGRQEQSLCLGYMQHSVKGRSKAVAYTYIKRWQIQNVTNTPDLLLVITSLVIYHTQLQHSIYNKGYINIVIPKIR